MKYKPEWKCGPAWLDDKYNPALSDFFEEQCKEHDFQYETNKGFWGKWKADWDFAKGNVRKALSQSNLFQKIRRLLEGIILFIMTKMPFFSHYSYVMAQKQGKENKNDNSSMQG